MSVSVSCSLVTRAEDSCAAGKNSASLDRCSKRARRQAFTLVRLSSPVSKPKKIAVLGMPLGQNVIGLVSFLTLPRLQPMRLQIDRWDAFGQVSQGLLASHY